jgi:helicase SWR1
VEERRRLNGTSRLPLIAELPKAPRVDTRTIAGHRRHKAYLEQAAMAARWAHIGYLNHLRCNQDNPIISEETISITSRLYQPLLPSTEVDRGVDPLTICESLHQAIKSYSERADDMAAIIDRFAFATPQVVARDLPRIFLSGTEAAISPYALDTHFDRALRRITVKLQIAFPDASLLQYDCGKLQELARLLRDRKEGGHRVLIFTQMTRILDILEIFLNLHGYLYLRLDGATKIEDRQYITERFNTDPRIFCFISSSRSGGVGIK